MNMLKDSFGRRFPYIRLSITDVCNFKCGYCLPNGYQKDKSDNRKCLHLDEIKRLAKWFAELGVCKIRITGGEPTVRKDFFEIIKVLKIETGIKKVVITTNGYHLDKKAKLLVDSGLNGINISIDSGNCISNYCSYDDTADGYSPFPSAAVPLVFCETRRGLVAPSGFSMRACPKTLEAGSRWA